MSRWIKILVAVLFSFSVLFIGVGYALTSGELLIEGTANADIPLIYIKSAVPLDSYASVGTVNSTVETTMNATANLSTSANTVIYRVTVANRSSQEYGYLATAADPSVDQNSRINYELYTDAACTDKMERRTLLPAHTGSTHGELMFYLKVSAKAPTAASAAYRFVLRYDFKAPISDIPAPGADSSAVAVDNAMTKFAAILNDDVSLAALKSQMSDQRGENDRASDTYIAYVPDTINGTGYTDDDKCLELFGGELNLIIDGVEYQVYFLLKRENVDNSTGTGDASGEEYTLYMTTDPLTSSSSIFSKKKAVVYAGVFTSDDDGDNWYQIGDMLKGEATICDYAGINAALSSGSGSFNTDTWATTQAYYGVAKGAKVASVMSASVNDRTQLQAAIAQAESIVSNAYYETVYTEASRTRLNSALTVAQNVNNNYRNYTQAQVVTYTAELQSAIASLADVS